MEAVIGFGIFCLVAIAFYKFIERKHKILFAKIIGLVAVVCALVAGGIWLSESWKNKQREEQRSQLKQMFTIEFDWTAAPWPSHRTKSIQIWKDWIETHPELKKLTPDQLGIMQAVLSSGAKDTDYENWRKYLDVPKEEGDLDWRVLEKEATPEEIETSKILEKNRLARYISKPQFPEVVNGDLRGVLLYGRARSFDHKDVETSYYAGLSREDKILALRAKDTDKRLVDILWDQFNLDQAQTVSFAIKICNKRDSDLNKVVFKLAGREQGRSTLAGFLKNQSYPTDYTEFDSDIIVKAKSCQSVTWTGAYKRVHEYLLTFAQPTWADGKSDLFYYENGK